MTEDIQEEFFAAASTSYSYAQFVREQLRATTPTQTFYHPTHNVTEQVNAVDTRAVALVQRIAEAMTLDDTLSTAQVVSIAQVLLATGTAQTFQQAIIEVLASIIARDTTYGVGAATVGETVAAAETTATVVLRVAQLLDAVGVSTAFANVLTIAVQETAEVEVADSVELTATLLAELLDAADVYSFIKTPSDLAQGWVVNLEGDMPISEYDNFVFNSLVQFNGAFYGTSDTGLYTAEGDTDDGDPITAQLTSLMLDFNTSRLKRIRSAYLGYTSTNELVLKVRSVDDGVLSEHWYKARPVTTAGAPRENRVTVGLGLKSRYWQFELTNIDGGDFEIDQLELYPLVLSRRV